MMVCAVRCPQIKIVDLGLSRFFEDGKPMRTVCGTPRYLAPEVVLCDREMLQGYDNSIDMWGVGLIAFIMVYNFNPFRRESLLKTYDAIASCE